MQLQDGHRAEQVGADDEPAGQPGREHHERERDPAAPGGHPRNEEWRIGERQVGAAEARTGATEQHRQRPDRQHGIAERVGRGVVVADRAQHQPRACAIEEPPDRRDERERQIDEGILSKQDPADQRQVGQQRDEEMRRRRDLLADEARADQSGQTDAEDGERETGGHLVDCEAEGQQREHRRQGGARRHPAQRPDGGRPADIGAGETAGGAHDHHAFDPEVEHPCPFGDELAGGREQERRGGGEHRQDDRFNQSHDSFLGPSLFPFLGRPRDETATGGCGGR